MMQSTYSKERMRRMNSVRRAFTAQIIINHIQARDGECIDNMDQALERTVANGVKNLVVQPTHLSDLGGIAKIREIYIAHTATAIGQ